MVELMKSPFVKFFGPTWLLQELEKKIPEFSKKMRLDEKEFRTAVMKVLEGISIANASEDLNCKPFMANLRSRDAKDLPYVILCVQEKHHGVLTRDKDIIETGGVRTWSKPGNLGKIVRIFEKGAFAYAIIGNMPNILTLLFELCISLLRVLWGLVTEALLAIAGVIAGAARAITKLPDWLKVAAIIGGILLLAWEDGRAFVKDIVMEISKGIASFLSWLYESMKNMLGVLCELFFEGTFALKVLYAEVDDTIKTYRELNSTPTSNQH